MMKMRRRPFHAIILSEYFTPVWVRRWLMTPEEVAEVYEWARKHVTDEELEAARRDPRPRLTTEELIRRLNARFGTNGFQAVPD